MSVRWVSPSIFIKIEQSLSFLAVRQVQAIVEGKAARMAWSGVDKEGRWRPGRLMVGTDLLASHRDCCSKEIWSSINLPSHFLSYHPTSPSTTVLSLLLQWVGNSAEGRERSSFIWFCMLYHTSFHRTFLPKMHNHSSWVGFPFHYLPCVLVKCLQ